MPQKSYAETSSQGMQRLASLENTLSSRYNDQTRLLMQANNLTNDILDTLESTATSASDIKNSFLRGNAAGGWWPYLVCPAVSIVMGSYGLPPSIIRNMGLLAFGELLGLLVSSYSRLSKVTLIASVAKSMATNTTTAFA